MSKKWLSSKGMFLWCFFTSFVCSCVLESWPCVVVCVVSCAGYFVEFVFSSGNDILEKKIMDLEKKIEQHLLENTMREM